MRHITTVKPVSASVRDLNVGRNITPARVLVLYKAGDSVGQQIAEYYRSARGIPSSNVIACTFTWGTSSDVISTAAFLPVLQAIEPHLISKDILAIVTCHWWPNRLSDGIARPISDALAFTHRAILGDTTTPWSRPINADFDAYPDGYKRGPVLWRRWPNTEAYPYTYLPPANRYAEQGANTAYVHFRLEVSPSPSGNEYTRTVRLIDDAIAAEQSAMQNFGKVVISGATTTYAVGACAWIDINQFNIPYTACYRSKISTEANVWSASENFNLWGPLNIWDRPTIDNGYIYKVSSYTTGITGASEPTWPTTVGATVLDDGVTWRCIAQTANSLPAGDTALTPGYGTFTPSNYTDVFLHVVGQEAYYGSSIQPQALTDFTYRRGAIAGWGMSYSATPQAVSGIDWDAGTRTLGNITGVNAKSVQAGIPCANENGISLSRLYCQYNGAAAAATISVSANTLTFFEDGVSVGSVALSGTLRSILGTIIAALPVSWVAGAVNGGAESRAQQSLRAGACIAIGSCIEPFTNAAFKADGMVPSIWLGEAMGEVAYKLYMPKNADSQGVYGGVTIYGDPLYRPFGHRRS